jgi:DNA invertase Pin-like site-specific DNA recombinase
VFQLDESTQVENGELNEIKSKKGRRSPEWGLPDSKTLLDLARKYLEVQRKLWPELVKQKVLPSITEENIRRMAEQFHIRFIGQIVSRPALLLTCCKGLGAVHARYSCDNSNPRSLPQQLEKALVKAHEMNVFVPWEWVFADAAVTGTVSARHGYQAAKKALATVDGPIILFIDEIGRASRDAVEALRLGKFVDNLRKRLVGASDGFDTSGPQSKMMLTIFGMLSEWYIDQLRSKVNRGMDDAFDEGKEVGKPAFGYKLVPKRDEKGRPLFKANGQPIHTRVLDKKAVKELLQVVSMVVDKLLAPSVIARWCNEHRVGGRQTWDWGQVVRLLVRETYRGFEFYRMTRHILDPETGGIITEKMPKEQWKRREVPHLRIFSEELVARIDARLSHFARVHAGRANQRPNANPGQAGQNGNVLVRPLCGYCGRELWLGRAGKYANLCCINGKDGKHGCKLGTYKALRIVEDAVVTHVWTAVSSEDVIQRVTDEANAFLAGERKRPRPDIKEIERTARRLKSAIQTLLDLSEKSAGKNSDAIATRIRKREDELEQCEERLRMAKLSLQPPPAPLTKEAVKAILADIPSLLSRDVPEAAAILRELTGPVTVTQETRKTGERGADWTARFCLNFVPVALLLASQKGCPTTGTWEYLSSRSWTTANPAKVLLRMTRKTELLAARVRELRAKGASVMAISGALGGSQLTIRLAIKAPAKQVPSGISECRQVQSRPYDAEIVRLRRERKMTFTEIGLRVGISPSTASRRYDRVRPAEVREAVESGRRPQRGTYRRSSDRGWFFGSPFG